MKHVIYELYIGWQWNDGFRYRIFIFIKKFIHISISKFNGYQIVVSFSSSPGNGYNLEPYPYPFSYYFNINFN